MVQLHGCSAPANMCIRNASAGLEAGTVDAVEAVARALHAHAAHEGVQRSGCFAMRILVELGAASQAKAAAAGAVEALVRSLQAPGESAPGAGWHGNACWALTFIIVHDACQADAPGGIEAVVATLRRATQECARAAAAASASAAAGRCLCFRSRSRSWSHTHRRCSRSAA